MPHRLDISAFQPVLSTATRAAFAEIKQQHANETLYAFALYTAGLGEYVYATANTEEALVGRTAGNASDAVELRWSPCDWPYHLEAEGKFASVQRLLAESDPYDLDEDHAANEQADDVFECCLRVLQELDEQGLFGHGDERDRIIINLLKGDQGDEERLEWARRLNSPAACDRLQQEMEAAVASWEEEWRHRDLMT